MNLKININTLDLTAEIRSIIIENTEGLERDIIKGSLTEEKEVGLVLPHHQIETGGIIEVIEMTEEEMAKEGTDQGQKMLVIKMIQDFLLKIKERKARSIPHRELIRIARLVI